MASLIIKHRVEDYKKWKSIFTSSDIIRRVYGEVSYKIFRNTEEPNDLSILFEWENPEKAIKYAQTQELVNLMKLAGVIDTPVVYALDGDLQ